MATAMLGDGDEAFALFQLLNPSTHGGTPEEMARYKVEPYVVVADVYTAPTQYGRGGWTWYTGSAGWMYRVALEQLLGLTKEGNALRLQPNVPDDWPGFSIEYRHGTAQYHIEVRQPAELRRRGMRMTIDGAPAQDEMLVLQDDGRRHEVVLEPLHPVG